MNYLKFSFFLFVSCLLLPLFAQRSAVKPVTATFNEQSVPSQSITLDAGKDKVEDLWDQFWDDRFDVDIDRSNRDKNSTTYLAEAVTVNIVSDKTMDVLSNVIGSENRSEVQLTVRFGYDVVVDQNTFPVEYGKTGMVLDDFQTYFYDRYFGERIAEVKDRLADVQDDKEDAVEDQSKAASKIRKWEDKILKYEEKIADARAEIGDEESIEASKADRVKELERELAELERMRRRYVK